MGKVLMNDKLFLLFFLSNFCHHEKKILAKLQGMLRLSMRLSVDADKESRAETSPCAIYLAFFLKK